jgi:uncharacterized protein (DUF885 family)
MFFKRRATVTWRLFVALAVLCASLAANAGPAETQEESRLFPETGKTVRGAFLRYWLANGGLPQQGFPISEEMRERSDTDGKEYTVQYFERAVFEAHPENKPPHDVLLSLLGNFRLKSVYPSGAPGQRPNSTAGSQLFTQTGKRVGGPFLEYWQKNGGLAQQGYPVTDEFTERSALDGKTYTVQYFERAVFELHPENQPPYNVLLSQLGTFRHRDKYAANTALDQFYERVFYEIGLRDPENFTALGLPRSFRPDFRNDKLTDISDAYIRGTYQLERKFLQELAAFDPKKQTTSQAISSPTLQWYLTHHTQGEEFMHHDYLLGQVTGAQVALHDLMVEYQPLTNADDARAYIARLEAFPARIDGVLAQMRTREGKGIFMPGWMIDRVTGQIRAMAPADARSSPFYSAFAGKLNALGNLSASDKAAFLQQAERVVADRVSPSYRRMADYLQSIRAKGRTTDGVWDLPSGDAYYRYMIRQHTNTTMTPDEIHSLGQREVARIQGEIKAALDTLGYRNMSWPEGINRVIETSGVYRTNTPQGKEEVLNAFRAIISKANSSLASQFDLLPRTPVEVRATPPEQEATAAGGYYYQPSIDGTRPGVFYANLGRGTYPKYNMPTLAYHEAVPGHHFQLAIQAERAGIPLFQKAPVFPMPTAYVEGWALYAEKLAAELGFYRDDPYGNIGRLKSELFRASRLVVDTGIHYKRWSRAQAIAYMDEANGTNGGAYTGEVERYIAWPGQALAYKIGELEILELRERAKTRMGSKFNIKEFHNVVLGSGSLPLSVLEEAVNRYIASK